MKSPTVIGFAVIVGLCLTARIGWAQPGLPPASPVLLSITQEAVVPGKLAVLLRNHAAAVQAARTAHEGRPALGLVSVSGPEEVWTFDFCTALADLESDRIAIEKAPAVRSRLERLDEEGGACISGRLTQTAAFLPDLSYQPGFDWSQARYLDVIVVHVRPGHHPEYLELRRMSLAGHLKGGLDGPLHVFKVNTGTRGLTWMIVRPLRSLRQHDELRARGFGEILTPEEDAKMVALRAASMEYAEERFFRIDPQISRVPEAWTRTDPEFWSASLPHPASR